MGDLCIVGYRCCCTACTCAPKPGGEYLLSASQRYMQTPKAPTQIMHYALDDMPALHGSGSHWLMVEQLCCTLREVSRGISRFA